MKKNLYIGKLKFINLESATKQRIYVKKYLKKSKALQTQNLTSFLEILKHKTYLELYIT